MATRRKLQILAIFLFLLMGISVASALTWTRPASSGGEKYDQDLNTYDSVEFVNLTSTGNMTSTACWTFENNVNLVSSSYWTFGRNVLSMSEGIKMFQSGSIVQYGWSCSGIASPDSCTRQFQIKNSGFPVLSENWSYQDEVFNYGRGEYTFSQSNELQLYYSLTGSSCSSGKRGCGGWICVVYDN